MAGTTSCRPRDHLVAAGQLYRNAWRAAESCRAGRGRELPDWAEWCYLPIAATYAIVADDAGIPQAQLGAVHPERIADAARLAALCAWRMTQGIYRFDPAVYDAVCNTPVAGDIPHDVLYQLPEWCVYIETPGMAFGSGSLHGAFAHLEEDSNTGRAELRLVLDADAVLQPVAMHLGPWPLAESLGRMLDVGTTKLLSIGGPALPRTMLQPAAHALEPLVSLLLYICSQAGEIGDDQRRPAKPQPVRTRRDGLRLFAPDSPTTWDVGVRLGAALRRAYQAEQTAQEGTHAGPRAHIRRAHWHGYWSGPRNDTQARRFDLRWMPPIAVNVDDMDQLPATVRPVR